MSARPRLPTQPALPGKGPRRHRANKIVEYLFLRMPGDRMRQIVASGSDDERRQFRELVGNRCEGGGPDVPVTAVLPMQPIEIDARGTPRFVANGIVREMLDRSLDDMNTLAMLKMPKGHRAQFAQLIGYSVDGFAELSYATGQQVAAADEEAEAVKITAP